MPRAKRDPLTGLTPQQEQFALLIATGESQSEAFRKSFSNSTEWKANTVWSRASVMAGKDAVAKRIQNLRAEIREKSRYTLEKCMTELDEAVNIARNRNDAKAMAQAIALRAKVNGLMVEERRNERIPLTDADDSQLDAAIAAAQMELGVSDPPQTIQ
jgi:hypothetical protein